MHPQATKPVKQERIHEASELLLWKLYIESLFLKVWKDRVLIKKHIYILNNNNADVLHFFTDIKEGKKKKVIVFSRLIVYVNHKIQQIAVIFNTTCN